MHFPACNNRVLLRTSVVKPLRVGNHRSRSPGLKRRSVLTFIHSHACAPTGHVHGGDEGPRVVVRIVALHAVQAVPGLRSSDSIHEAIQLAHRCLMPPYREHTHMNVWQGSKPLHAMWCVRFMNGRQMRSDLLMLRGAQLLQTLVTGSKASQFLRPFCPQGSDPPTTYNLLLREQTPERQYEIAGC